MNEMRVLQRRDQVSKAIANGIVVDKPPSESRIDNFEERIKQPKQRKPQFQLSEKTELSVLRCPNCGEEFGINRSFAENVSGVLYRYACPYCHYLGSIDPGL